MHPWRDTTKATIEGRALISAAKRHLGIRRPDGYELVYVLTSKDLWKGADGVQEANRDYSLVGIADCIGGIRFPTRAFAVGEVQLKATIAGIRFSPDGTASVAAHELGHLLGAHHTMRSAAPAPRTWRKETPRSAPSCGRRSPTSPSSSLPRTARS